MVNMLAELTDGIRRLQRLNKDMSDLELREEIFNLRQLLQDVREELQESAATIQELRRAIAFKEELVMVGNYRYRKGPDGQPKGAPFCPACEAKHGQFIPIARGLVSPVCPGCKSAFDTRLKFYADE